MPDAPEIPETKDPFDKRVALTIAILAICLSFIANLGDNSKTSSILKTSEASDQWNYFQAKSTKAQLAAMHGDQIMRLSTDDRSDDARNRAVQLGKDAQRYDIEKGEIKKQAEVIDGSSRAFFRHQRSVRSGGTSSPDRRGRLLRLDPGPVAQVLVAGNAFGGGRDNCRRHRVFHLSGRRDALPHVRNIHSPMFERLTAI